MYAHCTPELCTLVQLTDPFQLLTSMPGVPVTAAACAARTESTSPASTAPVIVKVARKVATATTMVLSFIVSPSCAQQGGGPVAQFREPGVEDVAGALRRRHVVAVP